MDHPYPVHVPKTFPIIIEKPVPYSVEKFEVVLHNLNKNFLKKDVPK